VKQKIKDILHDYKKRKISDENLTPAAVLIPLFFDQEQCHTLFTERSDEVNFHKGQICFPGGTRELSDANPLQTALRETEEEIGLKAEDVEIFGELDDSITSTGYLISPFVAFIPYPYPFKADRKEVKKIFFVPLSALMNEANFRQDYQIINGESLHLYYYNYGEEVIWGATARIVKQFIDLLRSGGILT
jgi:8-oxo-dGTP pyrophosphatase MutT (NUDIX family)